MKRILLMGLCMTTLALLKAANAGLITTTPNRSIERGHIDSYLEREKRGAVTGALGAPLRTFFGVAIGYTSGFGSHTR